MLYSAPSRIIAWNQITANPAAGVATTTLLLAVTTTALMSASRCYTIYCTPWLAQSSVVNDTIELHLLDSGAGASVTNASTQLALSCALENVAASGKLTGPGMSYVYNAPATGSHQFGLYYVRGVGTGNVTPTIGTGRNLQLWVEDVGPAVSAVS